MAKYPKFDNLEDESVIDFLAKNDSDARESFIERSEYRDSAYPRLPDFPESIDFWYDKGLYGRVDEEYNSVITKDEWKIGDSTAMLTTPALKKIPTEGKEVFVMNFVADAFVDFRNHMNNAANRGQIYSEDSALFPLEPKRGWIPIDNRYRGYIETLYEGFSNTFLKRKQNFKKVNNFKSFMRSFLDFLRETMPDFPFSKSGYTLSKRYPLAATGLVIELANEDHGDDEVKYNKFITDKNFFFYAGAAQKFGFRVDKNAPWRLVADIKSTKMQDYMSRYPELPSEPIPTGPAPVTPCELFFQSFDKYRNKKVVFYESNTRGPLTKKGIIQNIVCPDPNNPIGSATFVIKTICPGTDADLFDPSTIPPTAPLAPVIQWAPVVTTEAEISNRSISEPILPPQGTAQSYNTSLRVVSIPVPSWNNESAYLIGPGAGRTTVYNSPRQAPIYIMYAPEDLLPGVGSGNFYEWEVSEKPTQSSERVLFSLRGDPSEVAYGRMMEAPKIGFRPDVPGKYTFKLHAVDPITGNKLSAPSAATATFNWCNQTEADWWDVIDLSVPFPELYGRMRNNMRYILGFPVYIGSSTRDWSGKAFQYQGTLENPIHYGNEGWSPTRNTAGMAYRWTRDGGQHYRGYNNWWGDEVGINYLVGVGGISGNFLKFPNADPRFGDAIGNSWVSNYIKVMVEADVAFSGWSGAPTFTWYDQNVKSKFRAYTAYRKVRHTATSWRDLWTKMQTLARTRQQLWILQHTKATDPRASREMRDTYGGDTPPLDVFINWQPALDVVARDLRRGWMLQRMSDNSLPIEGLNFTTGFGRAVKAYKDRGGSLSNRWDHHYIYTMYWTDGGSGADLNHFKNRVQAGARSLGVTEQEFFQRLSDGLDDILQRQQARDLNSLFAAIQAMTPDQRLKSYLNSKRSGGPELFGVDEEWDIWKFARNTLYNNDPCNLNALNPPSDTAGNNVNEAEEQPPARATRGTAGAGLLADAAVTAEDETRVAVTREEEAALCVEEVVMASVQPRSYVSLPSVSNSIIWGWGLLEEDNDEFNQLRELFLQDVASYPLLKSGYDERVSARNDFLLLKSKWEEIHREANPAHGGALTFDNMFRRQFEKTSDIDIPTLKKYILDFYNSYVIAQPTVTITKINPSGEGTTMCVQQREILSKEEMEKTYPDFYWMEFYFALRLMETRKEINQSKLKNFRLQARNILSKNHPDSFERIIKLIDKETKGVIKEKMSLTRGEKDATI